MVGFQAIQNLIQMKNVVSHCSTIDKNIIKKKKKKKHHKFAKEMSKNLIHGNLEG